MGITLSNFNVNKILTSRNIIDRIEVAKVSLDVFSQKPLFGHGFSYVYSMELGPHNMLLRILVEGGLLGFVGLFVLLGGLLWVAFKRKSYKFLLLAIALTAMGSFTHNLLEYRSIIFISGLVFSSSRINLSRLLDSKINKDLKI
jgi:O-antigen ligase